ncbi:MAG: hypothetical protein ACI81V_000931 [Lentimonas sp.]
MRLRAAEAHFKVYGSGINDAMRERWTQAPNVEVVGFIENVVDAYKSSALMVCPVLTGGGTNIKVIEAAAYGRVCVLSQAATPGFREYPALHESLQYGDNAIEMTAVSVRLLQSTQDNQTLATQQLSLF